METQKESVWMRQVLPIFLTVVVAGVLTAILAGVVFLLNLAVGSDISFHVRWYDVLLGLTIYLKTSFDFALFIGHLMKINGGARSRIAIEIGTALGNALGTIAVLILWTFFREVKWLLALMILLAALVLLKLAEQSLEHAKDEDNTFPIWFRKMVHQTERFLSIVNKAIAPILSRVMPNISLAPGSAKPFWTLLTFSMTIPFVLGLDDFAGYVPLFSIVNVFGFGIGVFLGHMILNMFLYLSPERTVRAVKNPIVSFLGSIIFIGLAGLGIFETIHLIGF